MCVFLKTTGSVLNQERVMGEEGKYLGHRISLEVKLGKQQRLLDLIFIHPRKGILARKRPMDRFGVLVTPDLAAPYWFVV